jgi:hypothetical protein
MKKLLITISLLAATCMAIAAPADSSARHKIIHHIQLVTGDYAGMSFLSHTGEPTDNFSPNFSPNNSNSRRGTLAQYSGFNPSLPLYSFSMGFDYKVDFTPLIGLRTGINYFTFASRGQTASYDYPITFAMSLYASYIYIPIHINICNNFKKGRMIFDFGPDLFLPTNTFYTIEPGDDRGHYHQSGTGFFRDGTLGFTAGLGYEWKFPKGFAYEIMPDVRLLNMVPFDLQGEGVHVYSNYIFNTTYGLSTYFTFY